MQAYGWAVPGCLAVMDCLKSEAAVSCPKDQIDEEKQPLKRSAMRGVDASEIAAAFYRHTTAVTRVARNMTRQLRTSRFLRDSRQFPGTGNREKPRYKRFLSIQQLTHVNEPPRRGGASRRVRCIDSDGSL